MISLEESFKAFEVKDNYGLTKTIYNDLIKRYSESHRYYHSINHIEDLLNIMREYIPSDQNKNLILAAIWWHDCIYHPTSNSNEEDSANLFLNHARYLNLTSSFVEEVKFMILQTKNHTFYPDKHTKSLAYFLDADLSILGSDPVKYTDYVYSIKKEYSFIPKDIFNYKRAEILKSFLARKQLFFTKIFQARFEGQARINIQNEINNILS
jgi:predicted metal-dependent HD superfamily phosphohydrolase